MRGRWAFVFVAFVGGVAGLAACGGGHAVPAVTSLPGSGTASNAASSSVRVTLKVPSLSSLQSLRGPVWISPAAQSVVIGVTPTNANTVVKSAFNISPSSPVCTPAPNGRLCTLTIAAPVGSDVFSVDLYDGPVPSSAPLPGATSYGTPAPVPNHLGTTSVVATIAANSVNALQFTVGGLPATLVVTPATIVFTPYPYAAGGATPGTTPAPTAPAILTTNVYVSAQDADGVTIVGPDQYGSGITVSLYGGASPSPASPAVSIVGATNPTQVTLSSPAQGQPLALQYNTTIPYTTPLSLVATSNGIASATALVVNNVTLPPVSCTPQPDPTSLAVNFLNLDPANYKTAAGYSYNGLFHVPMSIGSPFPTAAPGSGQPPPTIAVTIDTGSVGLAVSTDLLYAMMGLPRPAQPTGANPTPIPFPSPLPPGVTGPTGSGQITYTSDGLMEIGQFFTVPLNIFTNFNSTAPVAVTVPTQILVVTNQGCNLNYLNGRTCTPNPVAYGVQNMGIGFYPLDIATVSSPVANPFLQLAAQELYGQIHRRYVINNSGMFFGGTASDLAGFQWMKLNPDRSNAGDWVQPNMCVSYPGQSPVSYTCGQMLVDTGLASMIMNIPTSQQIPNLPGYITSNKPVNIIAPGPGASPLALNWTFNAPGIAPAPFTPPVYPAPVPNGITINSGTAGTAFINTSQRIIYQFDYAYDADCGAVGFRPASPAPPPIP